MGVKLTAVLITAGLIALSGAYTYVRQHQPPPAPAVERGQVKVTQFYSAPYDPPPGQKTLLCYGVENADTVDLDPPLERLWPTQARCFNVTVDKPTEFTVTAHQGENSHSWSLTIGKGFPRVEIVEVTVNSLRVAPGEPVVVCYSVKNAARVSIEPGLPLGPQSPSKGCTTDRPTQDTTYFVEAYDAHNGYDHEEVQVRVRTP